MTNPLGFDALKGILHQRIAQLPDHRKKGPNTRYAVQDAALGAFGIFLTQSPSFLECQRRLQHTKGQNNAHTFDCRHENLLMQEPHITPRGYDAIIWDLTPCLNHNLAAFCPGAMATRLTSGWRRS